MERYVGLQSSPTYLSTIFYKLLKLYQGTYELPEDDLKASKPVGAFLSVLILTFLETIIKGRTLSGLLTLSLPAI